MEAQQKKKERDKAKIRFNHALKNLKKRSEEKETSVILINSALEGVKRSWKELEEAQVEFTLHIEDSRLEQENDMFSDLDTERETIIILAEDALVREENRKKTPRKETQDERPPKREDDRDEKGKPREKEVIIEKEKESMASTVASTLTSVGNRIGKLLSSVTVSKIKQKQFEKKVQDRLVDRWNEDTKCKVYRGVKEDKWEEFIERFQLSTGIDETVKADFEQMAYTDSQDDQIKAFTCEGTDLNGRYGMFALIKHEQTKKLDVAYAVYKFEAKFVGADSEEPRSIWHAVKDAKTGLFRKGEPVVEDVLTGKMQQPGKRFKMGDIDNLSQNFIIAKALSAFAQSGTIAKVNYQEEDEQSEGAEALE